MEPQKIENLKKFMARQVVYVFLYYYEFIIFFYKIFNISILILMVQEIFTSLKVGLGFFF